MSRESAVRAVVLVLMALAASAFVIDWNVVASPGGRRETEDATLQGDLTQLAAHVGGNLTRAPGGDYAVVHAGETLFGIDDADYRARVDQAAAEVAEAEAAVAQAEAQLALQDARLRADAAAIAGAQADLQRARLERLRQARLLHTESFLQRDWDNALSGEASQRAALDGRQRARAADSAGLQELRAALQGSRADLQAKRAAWQLAGITLGYTRIAAPFDAVATARLARRGEYVAPGRALLTLVPLGHVWVVANYREVQLTHVRPGQAARITVDALPGIVLHGHVDSLEPNSQASGSLLPPDRASGNFTKVIQRVPVKIALDPRPDLFARLRPGLSAEVWIDTEQPP